MTRFATNTIRSAFSLIELVVVILIIGILSAAAVPRFVDTVMHHRVESAARRIKFDIELARREAMSKSTARTLDFITGTTYELTEIASLDHPGQTYSVNLAAGPYSVAVNEIDFSGADHFSFSGYGIPTSGGHITIVAGQYGRQVVVDSATGNVTILEL